MLSLVARSLEISHVYHGQYLYGWPRGKIVTVNLRQYGSYFADMSSMSLPTNIISNLEALNAHVRFTALLVTFSGFELSQ